MKNKEQIQDGNCKICNELLSDYHVGEKLVSLTSSKPQSGFPHYRRGGWLQLFRMRSFGWEDRGKCNKRTDKGLVYYKICFDCSTELHIGREDNQSFRFCPKCLNKIKE